MARKRNVAGIRFGFNVLELANRWRAIHCLIIHCLINPLYAIYSDIYPK